MNLKIGITKEKPGWEIILRQEGVPNRIVSNSEIKPDEISALIVTDIEDTVTRDIIWDYVRDGGAVLVDSTESSKLFNANPKKKRVQHLISDPNSIYSNIGLLDINQTLKLPKLKKTLLLDHGLLISLLRVGKGSIIILPFDINEAILETSIARLKFYPPSTREFPSERVARISKGKIRRIVRISLEFLHYSRHLPFIKLWYYPNGARNVFLFRVDTDFCHPNDAKELYSVCEKNSILGSWFIETKSAKKWISEFKNMENQEIGLHCYWHYVFNDYQSNYRNIRMGLDLLDKFRIKPSGFAAPFGEWNENLGRAVEDAGFIYSSEFCLNYDDLPFYPYIGDRFSKVLQIPIHPIGVGRLIRSHFSEVEMWKYFRYVVNDKIRFNEPIILYHHPSNKHLPVLDKIFKYVSQDNILKTSFYEYANWWNKRAKLQISAHIERNSILIDNSAEFPKSVWVKISSLQGSSLTPVKSKIELEEIDWKKEKNRKKPAQDFSKLRRFHWHDLLYDLESLRTKKETIPKDNNLVKFGVK